MFAIRLDSLHITCQLSKTMFSHISLSLCLHVQSHNADYEECFEPMGWRNRPIVLFKCRYGFINSTYESSIDNSAREVITCIVFGFKSLFRASKPSDCRVSCKSTLPAVSMEHMDRRQKPYELFTEITYDIHLNILSFQFCVSYCDGRLNITREMDKDPGFQNKKHAFRRQNLHVLS